MKGEGAPLNSFLKVGMFAAVFQRFSALSCPFKERHEICLQTTMLRIQLATFLICYLTYVYGQSAYTGTVTDIVSGEPLAGVTIDMRVDEGIVSTVTNEDGHFIIEHNTTFSSSDQPVILRNTLAWSEQRSFRVFIFSLSGQILSQERVVSDHYILPSLSPGMFILRVTLDQSEFGYKVVSNGLQTYLVDQRAQYFQFSPSSDTLAFQHDLYVSRTKVVTQSEGHLNISLLRSSYQESIDFLPELSDPIVFDLLGGSPPRTNLSEVTSIKLIYDMEDRKIYYQNTSKYIYHFQFAEQVLGYGKGHFTYNLTQYQDHPDRRYLMGSVNYYHSQNLYVLQLVTANQMSCDQLGTLYNKIKETSYFRDDLVFLVQTDRYKDCNDVKRIGPDELLGGQNFQALNEARNYGYLRKVRLEELEDTYLGRRDLIVLDGIPNDIPVVAGIITTEYQTPLSHINILSHSRGTPNMTLRDAFESDRIKDLEGQLVYLDVTANAYELRIASFEEAELFWQEHEPQESVVLVKDTDFSELVSIEDADLSFLNRIGGKAANFAEIAGLVDKRGQPMPVPEGNAFAIPFFYYEQHLERSGIDDWIADLLINSEFNENPEYRAYTLELVRDSIKSFPVSQDLISDVESKIDLFSEFDSFRFRSSTNAEDLEGFTGAGLYTSKSAKKGNPNKTIEEAIQKVWASLWNWRAFEERSYFKIDHLSCAMGILVHRSFPDEDANGVMITRNLYNDNEGYTINVQFGEESIVFPEPGVLHDQIILFDGSIDGREPFLIEYLNFSNLPGYIGTVMTDEELKELGYFAKAIKNHYYFNIPNNCQCTYEEFGMDLEFKVDSEISPRKVYIKQARPYYPNKL